MGISPEVMRFFPYPEIREGQEEIMEKVEEGLRLGIHVLINGSTGIGKTVSVLAPLLEFCHRKGKRILYLTRTHTQQEMALKEFSMICKKSEISASAVGVQGKMSLCPLLYLDSRLREESIGYEEFSEICETLKENVTKKEFEFMLRDDIYFLEEINLREKGLLEQEGHRFSTCPFYYFTSENIEEALNAAISYLQENYVIDASRIIEIAIRDKICPYALMKELIASATMIVAPYNYLFQPELRFLFLSGYLGIANWEDLNDFCLVVDEAHNLPNFILETQKRTLSYITVKLCSKEIEEYKDVIIDEYQNLKEWLSVLNSIYYNFKLRLEDSDEEGFRIDFKEFYDGISGELGEDPYLASQAFLEASERILEEKRAEFSRRMKKKVRSYCRTVGRFLRALSENIGSKSCYVFVKPGPSVIISDLDSSKGGSIVNDFWSSIHMSGTLLPFDAYASEVGISNYLKANVGKEFLMERRRIFYHPGVSTRYQDIEQNGNMIEKIRTALMNALLKVGVKSLVFFPSYEIMNRVLDPRSIGILEGKYELVLQEDKRLSTIQIRELLEEFRRCSNLSLFIGVIGGRLSEGIDFPERSVEMIIIVGLPYPKPDPQQEAKYEYYKRILGDENRAWIRAYEVPMIRRLCQAMGRLIRGENDYGVIYVLDRRMRRISRKIGERAIPCAQPERILEEIKRLRKKFSIIERPLQRLRFRTSLDLSSVLSL